MLIWHLVSLERNDFHWKLFSGLDWTGKCGFVLYYFYRVEKFSWSVSEREKKKKIKVKCSDIFPEKRPPYSLIGFMFFSCLMIDGSLVH